MALYARVEHGGHPVVCAGPKVQVSWPTGIQEYRSRRQALIALVNQKPVPDRDAYDPKTSFDRYFRLGRHQKGTPPKFDIFELLSMPPNELVVCTRPALILSNETLTGVRPGTGFDLAKRAKEVRKLFFAGFAQRVHRYGYDPEDVLQDVYVGLMVRNSGKCPFDPTKASFGHYVHMVIGCILSNYRRRYSRLERNEVFGQADQEGEMQDVASSNLAKSPPLNVDNMYMVDELTRMLKVECAENNLDPEIGTKMLLLVGEGRTNREIVSLLNTPAPVVSRMLKTIKKTAAEWAFPVSGLSASEP